MEPTQVKFKETLRTKPELGLRYLLKSVNKAKGSEYLMTFLEFCKQTDIKSLQKIISILSDLIENHYISKIERLLTFVVEISDQVRLDWSVYLAKRRKELEATLEAISFDSKLDAHLKELNTPYSFKLLGDYYYEIKAYSKAIEVYNRSLELEDTYQVNYNIATVYSNLHNYALSVHHFDKANSQMPRNALILYNYGFTLQLSANYKKAKEVFEELSDVFESIYNTDRANLNWLNYGDHLAYNLGKVRQAIDVYEEALQVLKGNDQNSIKIRANLVYSYFKAKSQEKSNSNDKIVYNNRAWQLYDQLVNPDLNVPNELLAELHIIVGNYDNALAIFRQLEGKYLNNPDTLMFIGLCYFKLEDFKSAINYFKKSLEIAPNINIRNHLVESLRLSKDYDQSENQLNTIFEQSNGEINSLLNAIALYIDIAKSLQDVNEVESKAYYYKGHEIICSLLSPPKEITFSRELNIHERAQLYYDLGFIEVQLAKGASRSTAKTHLKKAINVLSDVDKESNLYVKSRTSIEKIKIHVRDNRRKLSEQRYLIYLGSILLGLTLFLHIFGRPTLNSKTQIESVILSKRMIDAGYDLPVDSINAITQNKIFRSTDDLKSFLDNLTYPDTLVVNLKGILEGNQTNNSAIHFERPAIGEAVAIFLITISIGCIILGLLFDNISSITFGKISIEKSGDQKGSTFLDFKMSR